MIHKTVFVNARFYTSFGRLPVHELAVENGRVVDDATGSAEKIDLKGTIVIPAFWDSHIHLFDYAANAQRIVLDDCRNREDVLQLLRRKSAEVPRSEWVLGRG